MDPSEVQVPYIDPALRHPRELRRLVGPEEGAREGRVFCVGKKDASFEVELRLHAR